MLKKLLQKSDNTIKEISYTLNFSNPSFLGKYFKRLVGVSPADYQRKIFLLIIKYRKKLNWDDILLQNANFKWLNPIIKYNKNIHTMNTEQNQDMEVKILEAAKVVFVRKGYESTKMSDIAAEVGIGCLLVLALVMWKLERISTEKTEWPLEEILWFDNPQPKTYTLPRQKKYISNKRHDERRWIGGWCSWLHGLEKLRTHMTRLCDLPPLPARSVWIWIS